MPQPIANLLAMGAMAKRPSPQQNLLANSEYVTPVPYRGYQTQLDPQSELEFQQWVKANGIPFDPSETADYDMRGYFRALKAGQVEGSSLNPHDGLPHFTDRFKTPYHESFSAGSRYARAGAPEWNERDQLVSPGGVVLFDEPQTMRLRRRTPYR